MSLSKNRKSRFKEVASFRQADLTVVLENVHDPHNIGAVMRTCDAVGVSEIFVLNTDERLQDKSNFFGKASSSGTRKWVDVNYFENAAACFDMVKTKYDKIIGTHLSEDAQSLYDLDLSESCALVFGNEHDGISEETLGYLDSNIQIPQYGMVKSLNISVACAICLYESCRQRLVKGKYEITDIMKPHARDIYNKYLEKDGRQNDTD